MKKTFTLFLLFYVAFSLNAQKNYKCINEQGDVLFEFNTNFVWPFSDGMAKFKTSVNINGQTYWRIGFVDENGEIAIDPIYESKKSSNCKFIDGVAWVRLPEKDGYFLIDKNGSKISEKLYSKIGTFHEGMCAVYDEQNMGFINIKGEEIIPMKFTGEPQFNDGLVCLCLADDEERKYGFMNKLGEIVIPFQFVQTGYSGFNNGECRVMIDGKTNLIDKTGNITFTPTLSNNMEQFSCGLAKSFTRPDRKACGFFNRNNQWIIKPIYDKASSFENGLAIVSINDKYGVIDTLGRFVIPLKYDKIEGNCIDAGFFLCEKDLVKYYYNCEGNYFTQRNVKRILNCNKSDLYPFLNDGNKWGYLNADGSICIDAQFDNADSFAEGKAWVY